MYRTHLPAVLSALPLLPRQQPLSNRPSNCTLYYRLRDGYSRADPAFLPRLSVLDAKAGLARGAPVGPRLRGGLRRRVGLRLLVQRARVAQARRRHWPPGGDAAAAAAPTGPFVRKRGLFAAHQVHIDDDPRLRPRRDHRIVAVVEVVGVADVAVVVLDGPGTVLVHVGRQPAATVAAANEHALRLVVVVVVILLSRAPASRLRLAPMARQTRGAGARALVLQAVHHVLDGLELSRGRGYARRHHGRGRTRGWPRRWRARAQGAPAARGNLLEGRAM